MFLNVLRISASNVLKTFFNIIVSIGCIRIHWLICFTQTKRKHKCALLLVGRYPGRQEGNIITNKSDFFKKEEVVHAQR